MEPILRAEGLVKHYDHLSALRGVDLHANSGDSLVLLGPNGAGKSTLLGILAGRIGPTEGRVILQGQKVGKASQTRSQLGYLAHSSLLYRGLTARENLMLYCDLYRVEDSAGRSEEMLRFMGLWERRDDQVGGFSRGMEQRLSIARSLLHDPQLILLDEPFTGLDHQSSKALIDALGQLRDGRRILVVITHDMDAVANLGEEMIVMNRGRILHRGSVPRDTGDSVRELYMRVISGAEN